jgi:hypothetical protein
VNPLVWLYLAQPITAFVVTFLLLLVYYRRDFLTVELLGFSFLAYSVAIGGKVMVQLFLSAPSNLVLAGAFYSLQTVLLEVGLAYLFARYALAKNSIRAAQAPAYGAALAFWENGLLLGILALPATIVAISAGGSGLPSGSLGEVLALVALGTLERLSSVLLHFSWGVLTVIAAASRKTKYLWVALPMGLVDFLVPFANSFSLLAFELTVFLLSALSLVVTYLMTRKDWPAVWRFSGDPARPIAPSREGSHL